MGRFRRRDAEVEAFQLTRERMDSYEEWPDWLRQAWLTPRNEVGAVYLTEHVNGRLLPRESSFRLRGEEGEYLVMPDDWLVFGSGPVKSYSPSDFDAQFTGAHNPAEMPPQHVRVEAALRGVREVQLGLNLGVISHLTPNDGRENFADVWERLDVLAKDLEQLLPKDPVGSGGQAQDPGLTEGERLVRDWARPDNPTATTAPGAFEKAVARDLAPGETGVMPVQETPPLMGASAEAMAGMHQGKTRWEPRKHGELS
ncbi:MAG: hypothetical protein OXC11_13430 [Rhodospirillales bacterium]|nr:hypothetical protein [Rhodospirillales bacterium]